MGVLAGGVVIVVGDAGLVGLWLWFVNSFLCTAGVLLNGGVNVIFSKGIVICAIDLTTVQNTHVFDRRVLGFKVGWLRE